MRSCHPTLVFIFLGSAFAGQLWRSGTHMPELPRSAGANVARRFGTAADALLKAYLSSLAVLLLGPSRLYFMNASFSATAKIVETAANIILSRLFHVKRLIRRAKREIAEGKLYRVKPVI